MNNIKKFHFIIPTINNEYTFFNYMTDWLPNSVDSSGNGNFYIMKSLTILKEK